MNRKCLKCGESKPVNEFKIMDKIMAWCNPCWFNQHPRPHREI